MDKLDYINIKDTNIPVKFNNTKKCKGIKLSFNINKGYLLVSKSPYISKKMLLRHLSMNETLIYEEYLKMLRLKKENLKRKWITGEKFLYLGKEYEICIREVKENVFKIDLENNKIIITIKLGLDETTRRNCIINIVKKFLKEKSEQLISQRIKYWTKVTGIYFNSIRVKYVKTRWGSCVKSTKSLNFSSRLIMFPIEIIDAVIVHELCHIVYPNHSVKFWNLVYNFIPKYEEYNKWIKNNMFKFEIE